MSNQQSPSAPFIQTLKRVIVSPLLWGLTLTLALLFHSMVNPLLSVAFLGRAPMEVTVYLVIGVLCCLLALLPNKVLSFFKSRICLFIACILLVISSILYLVLLYVLTTTNATPFVIVGENVITVYLLIVWASKLSDFHEEDIILFVSLSSLFGVAICTLFEYLPVTINVIIAGGASLAVLFLSWKTQILPQTETQISYKVPKAAWRVAVRLFFIIFIIAAIYALYESSYTKILPSTTSSTMPGVIIFFLAQSTASLLTFIFLIAKKHPSFSSFFRIMFCVCVLGIALTSFPMLNPAFGGYLRELSLSSCYLICFIGLFSISKQNACEPIRLILSGVSTICFAFASPIVIRFIFFIENNEMRFSDAGTIAILLCVLFCAYLVLFDKTVLETKFTQKTPLDKIQVPIENRCLINATKYELSKRERELLPYFASSKSNREIAAHFYIAEGTVNVHQFHVFQKLGIHNRNELVALVNNVTLDD